MKNFARRIAVVVGAAAVSVGLIGATAVPAHAADDDRRRAGARHQLGPLSRPHRFETRTRLSPHLSGPSAYPPGPSQQHEGSDRKVAALVTFPTERPRNDADGDGSPEDAGGVEPTLTPSARPRSSSWPETPIRPIV